MIAPSFRGAVFGPAQALHGATFVVDAAFMADALAGNGIVIDIARAHARPTAARASVGVAASRADAAERNGIVIDIARAHEALKAALAPLNYRNLDDVPELK